MTDPKKSERKTLQLFDLMFKMLLTETSHPAVVHFINGLFDKNYPPDSEVIFANPESVTAPAPAKKLEKIQSDLILIINGDAFLIEAQIGDDENIALRVFQYGFAYARQKRQISADDSTITLTMPEAKILYWETSRKTPNKVTLDLVFPDGAHHRYEVETVKMLEQSMEAIERRKLILLLPFCLLKFRKEMRQKSTGAERRRQLAAKMKTLLRRLEALIERGCAEGWLNPGDAITIMDGINRMHGEIYYPYPEFKETAMELKKRLIPKWKEYYARGERKGEQKGEQKGIMRGEQECADRIISLLEHGYTLEQIKQLRAQNFAT